MANDLLPPKAPNLPVPSPTYNQRISEQTNNALRVYFNQLDNVAQILITRKVTGTAVILSITDITPTSTTGTAYSALVSSTVSTTKANSRLKITINIVMTKATNAGTVTFNMLQGATVLSTPFFSFTAGYGVTMAFTVYTAAIATPSSQAIAIKWKRDSAGEVTSYGSSTLEVTEVYA